MPKPPEKADGAFRTIREVADWLVVPTHVLRFWESKFPQIAPVKGPGGRRYYRPEDMRLLGGIKVMLHDQGMTIRAVGQKIDDDGVEPVMAFSPELETPGQPAQRTRRVIRNGEDDGARVLPFERRKRGDAAPADASDAAQPDTPQTPREAPAPVVDDPAPQPADGPPEPLLPDREMPDVALTPEAPSEPVSPGPPTDAPAPRAPSDLTPPATPSELPVEPENARGQPVDPPSRDAPAEPPSLELPPFEHAALPASLAALRLARAARGVDPAEQRRLRRFTRKLRGLIEEIAEELERG
ncbi:MerR family transcriptional regulator [Jannaschia ovalis]|uniref:MerR family transcriptional regulator n=1 Tax=Jannaschia ovalis TaxID=3038773 RepID=A0ABY8LCC1_9RHOB|nr:MerR family transcriptional regulator [Jannaschia sp. GRR-S6-38]WGH78967.1 MerR family transcriptional regulator [Jannaschia sp. GRR-S6-38]